MRCGRECACASGCVCVYVFARVAYHMHPKLKGMVIYGDENRKDKEDVLSACTYSFDWHSLAKITVKMLPVPLLSIPCVWLIYCL